MTLTIFSSLSPSVLVIRPDRSLASHAQIEDLALLLVEFPTMNYHVTMMFEGSYYTAYVEIARNIPKVRLWSLKVELTRDVVTMRQLPDSSHKIAQKHPDPKGNSKQLLYAVCSTAHVSGLWPPRTETKNFTNGFIGSTSRSQKN